LVIIKLKRDLLAAGKSIEAELFNHRSTAESARLLRKLPRKTRLCTRDFIHNSLYNPHYGYFSKNVKVFSPDSPFQFEKLENSDAFMMELGRLYALNEKESDIQIWHTPSEIFQPFYGRAIGNYILQQFMSDKRGANELVIYEVGAGNGTLMKDVLDFIKEANPSIYKRTEYNIVEISSALIDIQSSKIQDHPVRIISQSILEFEKIESRPCFFLAMEVLVTNV
jgi:SAM-dependent MidA family methyltransferase